MFDEDDEGTDHRVSPKCPVRMVSYVTGRTEREACPLADWGARPMRSAP